MSRLAFVLAGAQVADCEVAKQLLERLPARRVLHGDKDCDTSTLRQRIEANIPPKANRVWKKAFAGPVPGSQRERMFCRLKDVRRTAKCSNAA